MLIDFGAVVLGTLSSLHPGDAYGANFLVGPALYAVAQHIDGYEGNPGRWAAAGAWVIGLLLAWRTGERLLNPLVQLERLMRKPPQQLAEALDQPIFERAPDEIKSLSSNFQSLVLEVNQLLGQLEDQLRTDGLTAIGNRRHYDATLSEEWQRGLRSGKPLSLLDRKSTRLNSSHRT